MSGSVKILGRKNTPFSLGGGSVTPGEVLCQVGDHPPGDGVHEEAQGLILVHGLPRLVTGYPWHRAWN